MRPHGRKHDFTGVLGNAASWKGWVSCGGRALRGRTRRLRRRRGVRRRRQSDHRNDRRLGRRQVRRARTAARPNCTLDGPVYCTVTVYVRGQWNWYSHNSDCNTDRAGAGVGIIWNDPTEPGYTVRRARSARRSASPRCAPATHQPRRRDGPPGRPRQPRRGLPGSHRPAVQRPDARHGVTTTEVTTGTAAAVASPSPPRPRPGRRTAQPERPDLRRRHPRPATAIPGARGATSQRRQGLLAHLRQAQRHHQRLRQLLRRPRRRQVGDTSFQVPNGTTRSPSTRTATTRSRPTPSTPPAARTASRSPAPRPPSSPQSTTRATRPSRPRMPVPPCTTR